MLESFSDGDSHTGISAVVDKLTTSTEVELTHPVVPCQVLPSQSETQACPKLILLTVNLIGLIELFYLFR